MRIRKIYSEQIASDIGTCFNPDDYDWWCDECDASLDEQEGFFSGCGLWTCEVCGCLNFIDESSILEGDGAINREYSEDSGEPISVYEAAEIWASNGKDEDYSFGFTDEELNQAFNE